MKVLVTGATGYIGGRLIPRLLSRGHSVRALVRDPGRAAQRVWSEQVELVEGDLLNLPSLENALKGIEAAYYLVHSMYAESGFEALDRAAAANFALAAQRLRLVVYLGGLQPAGGIPSRHLKSREEVGSILRESLPTTEFRAGPIIGSGSAPFEIVRYLTERLPVMVAPRWILNEVQPIGIRDMLTYLEAALEYPPLGIVEVGGERLPFKKMMETYAAVRGLRRIIIPLPVLAPTLAALWIGLVTPVSNRLAVPLVQGMVRPLCADTEKARKYFPAIHPLTYRECVQRALQSIERGEVQTRWSDALGGGARSDLTDREGLIREIRAIHVDAPPARVFRTLTSLGGDRGWLVWNSAWVIRGALDKLVGGPGLRRGRRHPTSLFPGEAVDFWRVEAVATDQLLRLRAEMKLPGKAWLQWEIEPEQQGCRLIQTALFAPKGFFGALYWYSLYPFHKMIFSDLVRAIAKDAVQDAR